MRQLKINKSITNRDAASLDKYLTDISKLPLITAEEETILAQKIRQGDDKALEKLTVANLRFVVSVAKQYQNQGISLADLINEGNLGLMKAAKRFDETRGFKFISYAVWWIRQAIIEAISNQSRIIRLPLNKITALNKIKKAHSVLEQQLERQPSLTELSEAIEISETEVALTLMASQWNSSTDSALGTDDNLTILDVVYDPEGIRPDDVLIEDSLQEDIRRVLSTLTQRECDIVMLYYGIGLTEGLSLEEIAEKFELTRERVRQIKEKAIRRLRYESRGKLLKDYLG